MARRQKPNKYEQTALDTLNTICKESKVDGTRALAAIAILQAYGRPITAGVDNKRLKEHVRAINMRLAKAEAQERGSQPKRKPYTKKNTEFWEKKQKARPDVDKSTGERPAESAGTPVPKDFIIKEPAWGWK